MIEIEDKVKPKAQDLKNFTKAKINNLKIDNKEIQELRPAQEEIISKFTQALNQNKHILIQAPTGCGKTLAYSLVADYVIEKGGRVMIVCPTKDLQKQISVTCHALNLDFIEIYGSGEYICPLRNKSLKRDDAPVVTLLCKRLEKCQYKAKRECDYFKSREIAKDFPLVITNYSKYIESWDILKGRKKFDLIIFDEAHNIESIAEQSSRVYISSKEVEDAKGYLKRNYEKIEKIIPIYRDFFDLEIKLEREDVIRIIGHFEKLIKLFEKRFRNIGNAQDIVLSEEDMEQLIHECKNLINSLEQFSIIETLFILKPEDMKALKLKEKLDKFTKAASRFREKYRFKIRLKGGDQERDLEIIGEPLVREMIRYIIKNSTKLQCHVGATLGNFSNYAQRIGISKADFISCEITDYPFDLKRRILLGLIDGPPMNIYKKNERDYPWGKKKDIANKILEKLLLKWPGNTLIFFRSRKEASSAYEFLLSNPSLAPRLIFRPFFKSGKERRELIEHFGKKKGSILFGFGKMDQGIDLPGEALTLIVVYSLPFIYRTKQMVEDYQESKKRYGTSGAFEKVDLEVAAKRLSQLIGRLVRTEDDFGAVVILDKRFYGKFYRWMKGKRMLPKDIDFSPKNFVPVEKACEILEKLWEATIGESYSEYLECPTEAEKSKTLEDLGMLT